MVRFVRFISLVLFIVGLPTLLVFSVVNNNAQSKGSVELQNIASTYRDRANDVLSTAVDRLRTLAQSGLNTCTASHRHVFQDAARSGAFIHAVGMVDEHGNVMCMEPDFAGFNRHILPATAKDDPLISYHVVDMNGNRGNSLFAAWRIENDMRIVVATTPEAIDIKAGPEWLRNARDLRVIVNEDDVWHSQGRLMVGDNGRTREVKLVSVDSLSEQFPVSVVARAPMSVLASQTDELEGFFALSAVVVGAVIFSFLIWQNLKSGQGLEDEIKRAIRRREFIAHYQPVMNLDTGQLAGCEALIRWRKRDGTLVSPGRFLPYAETSGLIYGMTRQVMRRVQADLGDLYEGRKNLKVSINLVAGHFDSRKICDDAEKVFGSSGGVDFEQVVFEVTERLPLNDIDKARDTIKELQNMGIRVALDDAGTGHGGLAYIQQLGIDIIKIDKMFVDSLGKDRGSSAIVDLLVELAANLEMGVIAEGVEESDQVDELREMGVTFAQGYIFAPPLPPNQFIALAQALSTNHSNVAEAIEQAEAEIADEDDDLDTEAA